MNLSKYTKPEIDKLRIDLNLTDDELAVFDRLAKGKSVVSIAMDIGMCTRAVDKRIKSIKDKLERLKEIRLYE